jgi:ligand-binding SRPBCC domain-containing protein
VSFVIERSSNLGVDPETLWAVVATPAGVNAELRPWIVMRFPRRLRRRALTASMLSEVKQPIPCWMLLGGVVPFDRHRLGFESIDDGSGFVEESTSWLQARWLHERTVRAAAGGSEITDRITCRPRLIAAWPVSRLLVAAVFRHRHRRLRRTWGRPTVDRPQRRRSR